MGPHVCSWRIGFFLDNALRRIVHDPEKILGDLVGAGQTAVDVGCGPGFFSIPLAQRVGVTGAVIAADLQPEMLEKVRQRADQAGLNGQLRLHRCQPDRIGLETQADFALAFYMVHEVPDAAAFLKEIQSLLKPGGHFLLVEPKFHVTAKAFDAITSKALDAGLIPDRDVQIALSRARLYQKTSG
ncbi:MAG: class I SAM-dependent methyltransferase [Desulfobacterales bacterium]|nr:class I SAM-dependent methyltransferase [Desulfobacterales bacterium]